MAQHSEIEWTDASWNPVRGCRKISPGCKHCYAETFAERFRGVQGHPYERGFDPRLIPEKLGEPLKWASPKLIFVNSMSDLFLEDVPDDYIVAIARIMQAANWHTYQVLTKRAERMKQMLQGPLEFASSLPHIWWGVSVEDRKHGIPRIDHLRDAPAQVRFLSIEPLLEDISPRLNLDGIHWAIVGGESGPGFRPIEENWVRTIQQHCQRAGTAFFFKQWGGYPKGKRGRLLDGQAWDEMPIRITSPVPEKSVRQMLLNDLTVWPL